MDELSLHNLLSTMRLTDFIADLIQIKNYQKLLLNKGRKYQIKQLREDKGRKVEELESQDELIDTKLNASYFETRLLSEKECTLEWLYD